MEKGNNNSEYIIKGISGNSGSPDNLKCNNEDIYGLNEPENVNANYDVLIVDDNMVNLIIANNLMKVFHITPDNAKSGKEAINMVKVKRYDLIFMDHLMPEMDGVETVHEIRKLGKPFSECPIVALVATVSEEVEKLFSEAGVYDIIQKPIEIEELKKILNMYLFKKTQLRMEQQDNEENNVIRNCFSGIAGIDYEAGIRYAAGSELNFVNVARTACQGIADLLEDVRRYSEIEDFFIIRRAFHSLKSIYSSLGFKNLSEFAMELEEASRKSLAVYINENINRFIVMSDVCLKELSFAVKTYDNISGINNKNSSCQEEEVLQVSDVLYHIDEIKSGLKYFEIFTITDNLKELSEHAPACIKEDAKTALKAAGVFEYEHIEKLVESMLDKLQKE